VSAAFVVDTSVALAWFFDDEATPKTEAVFDRLASETALVPSLWFLEIANTLALAERKGRVVRAKSDAFLVKLNQFDFEVDVDGSKRALIDILPFCRQHKLTSYDAAYLELALRRNLPLATLDSDLRKIAKSLGVVLLGL
jgi:predicted nucleic acid-binding protein